MRALARPSNLGIDATIRRRRLVRAAESSRASGRGSVEQDRATPFLGGIQRVDRVRWPAQHQVDRSLPHHPARRRRGGLPCGQGLDCRRHACPGDHLLGAEGIAHRSPPGRGARVGWPAHRRWNGDRCAVGLRRDRGGCAHPVSPHVCAEMRAGTNSGRRNNKCIADGRMWSTSRSRIRTTRRWRGSPRNWRALRKLSLNAKEPQSRGAGRRVVPAEAAAAEWLHRRRLANHH